MWIKAGDPFLLATSKMPMAVRGLTKKEAAVSTGRDWSRTHAPKCWEKFNQVEEQGIGGELCFVELFAFFFVAFFLEFFSFFKNNPMNIIGVGFWVPTFPNYGTYLEVWQACRYTLARCLHSCRKFQPSCPSCPQP